MADRDRRALSIVLAAATLVVAATAGASSRGVIVARSGAVRAELQFMKAGYDYASLRLTIVRSGRLRLERPLGRAYSERPTLHARDLDGDRDPEVWVDTYTGGAHCCTWSRLFRWDRGRYRATLHGWGNVFPPYRVVNYGRDAWPELRSADDRFAYVFTSFASSLFPVRIWRFDHGRMVDVTRRFPVIVEQDADSLWRTYRRWRRGPYDVRGVLAAWMADMYLLGHEEDGWRALDAAHRRGEFQQGYGWPSGRRYLRALQRFLEQTGYAR